MTEPVAIIGIGCRFPGASGPESFWRALRDGVDSISEVPSDRWDIDAFYDANPAAPGKMNTRWGGFLDDVRGFDASFFSISPREAASMDPQQRIALEVAWEALEDAGLVRERLAGSQTGVFMAVGTMDYQSLQSRNSCPIESYTNTGIAFSLVSNRISYVFDLRGPSVALETACSGSLVAVHLACQSLSTGEATIALAGGVNVILSPWTTIGFSKLGALSPDGRCKAFDARANGYVRGEGAGVVVLKPLAAALADDDRIYAVIRASAVNQDGRSNGLTAPNRWAQEALLKDAYKRANVPPGKVQYVEAHGAGTLLGDPIEANALGAVLSIDRPPESPCALGSVKTNIGHLETAAGVAGLIKVALSLKHRAIPPSLHFHEPNPHIPFAVLPLRVQRQLGPWRDDAGSPLAGVSSFGFGGTNAHVVLEQAPETPARHDPRTDESAADQSLLLPLSAHSAEALRDLARAYVHMLSVAGLENQTDLRDICYSASVRRSHHDYHLAVVHHHRDELSERLETFLERQTGQGISSGRKHPSRRQKLVFVFPGQGSQWFGMGRQLLRRWPAFRQSLERCEEAFRSHVDWSLIEQLSADEACSRLSEIDVIQPTLFALQVSLAALWKSWGVEPDAVVGHSMGEVAAAHIAGALSLQDAARVICRRSRLLRRASGRGGMAVVELSIEQAQLALSGYEDRLSIAASNSHAATVLSGETEALDELMESLTRREIFCRPVKVDVASHSPQMDAFRDELFKMLEGLDPVDPVVPIYSTVGGRSKNEPSFDAAYWVHNLREPVLFSAAVEQLLKDGHQLFLELSPHPILLSSIQQVLQQTGQEGLLIASTRRAEDETEVMLNGLGALYAVGRALAWEGLYPSGGRFVRLPSYPWQHQDFWFEPKNADPDSSFPQAERKVEKSASHPLLGRHVRLAQAPGTHIWEGEIGQEFLPYLSDHQVQGVTVLPGTAYVEMALAAGKEAFHKIPMALSKLEFHRALFLPLNAVQKMQVVLSSGAHGSTLFNIYSYQEGKQALEPWVLHSSGELNYEREDELPPREIKKFEPEKIQLRCGEVIEGDEYYRRLLDRGMQYGPSFQGISRLWRCDGEAVGYLRVSETLEGELDAYELHPAILDACLQVLGAVLPQVADRDHGAAFVPTRMAEVRVHRRPTFGLWSHALLRQGGQPSANSFEGDIYLYNDNGELVAQVIGLRCESIDQLAPTETTENLDQWLYELKWQSRSRTAHEQHTRELAATASHRGWLIFSDGSGVGERLAALIAAKREDCFLVSPGQTFSRLAGNRFQLQPDRAEDFAQLFDVLGKEGRSIGKVVHLWSLYAAPVEELSISVLEAAQTLGCLSVLRLVQELARREWSENPQLWLVTQGCQSVGENPASIAIAQSSLWGFGRTIAQEHPSFWGGMIDLDPESKDASGPAQLLSEIDGPGGEDHLAFRAGERYVARLLHLRDSSAESQTLDWRPDGSYLLTGGLGDLGLAVARWMVEQGARQLILIGRSVLPQQDAWKDVALGSRAAYQIAALEELEAMGARVRLASFDIADEAQLMRFLRAHKQEGGPAIRGVIHLAGALRDQTLLQMDPSALAEVFRPKVIGGWLLHRLMEDEQLDFFVLFSSAASLFGSAGQANYAAANAFLDALAHQRRAEGKPGLSINWGPWAEIGLAAKPERGRRLALQGIGSIKPSQGLKALAHLLTQPSAQVAVVPINWRLWQEFAPAGSESPLLEHLLAVDKSTVRRTLVPPAGLTFSLASLREAAPPARQKILEGYLLEQVGRVLGLSISRLDTEMPLNRLGFDSLMAVQLKNRLAVDLGVVVPIVRLLQAPTVAELSAWTLEQLQAELTEYDQLATLPVNATLGRDHLPEQTRAAERKSPFVPPRIPTERMLADILAESLPLDQLGVYDNLPDLSELTHSAARVISRVREVFHVDLSLADLLATPSVGALSISIVSKQARELKDEDMALLLKQLEGITEEEAQTMLAD